jgi:two-component system chemotaxis sensor kinase CheA
MVFGMDDLLQEFLSETGENIDTVDRELVRFEQEPNNREILRNIFRLVHTVKGTCGFIGLPRLEALTHAAESVIGQFRDGATVSAIAVTAILETIDCIKEILAELAEKGQEPIGNDEVLITELMALADQAKAELSHLPPENGEPSDPVAAI